MPEGLGEAGIYFNPEEPEEIAQAMFKIEKDKIRFNISGIDVGLANALRRIIISEIPTMAIESVTFYENSSILDDEFLALRLGLIPIKTDPAGPDQIAGYLRKFCKWR